MTMTGRGIRHIGRMPDHPLGQVPLLLDPITAGSTIVFQAGFGEVPHGADAVECQVAA